MSIFDLKYVSAHLGNSVQIFRDYMVDVWCWKKLTSEYCLLVNSCFQYMSIPLILIPIPPICFGFGFLCLFVVKWIILLFLAEICWNSVNASDICKMKWTNLLNIIFMLFIIIPVTNHICALAFGILDIWGIRAFFGAHFLKRGYFFCTYPLSRCHF